MAFIHPISFMKSYVFGSILFDFDIPVSGKLRGTPLSYDETVSTKQNFIGYRRQKNPVQNGKKIQFIKLDISTWRIAKIKCRYIGGKVDSQF